MKKLRKQIKESFFNPILHFLPLLIFLVADEFFGMSTAWKIAFPVALTLVIYVYYVYNQLFTWHLVFTFMFMGVGVIASTAPLFPIPILLLQVANKIVILIFTLAFIFFRKQIQRTITRIMPKLIPMSNNFNELYRVIWALAILLAFYISTNSILQLFANDQTSIYLKLLRALYLGIILFLVIYELIRVQIIRANLVREEWWPIVSEQGKIIGSIQHLTSLFDEKKYLHPIARVIIIDKSMIFLQKRPKDDLICPGLWDTAISNHVRMGENVEQCIERTAIERYAITGLKYMYLSNYTFEAEKERHYTFLFVSCQQAETKPNATIIEQSKWWTQQQIEDNLNTGIFTENFKIEFDLLRRSGLLETGQCECSCKLKDVIYQQPTSTKKE